MPTNKSIGCTIGCSVCLLTSLFIFIIMSVGTVEPIEYALKLNSISKKYDKEEVFTGGWYMIGIFNNFLTFPATLVNLDFSNYEGSTQIPFSVKDSGGQEVTIEMSV